MTAPRPLIVTVYGAFARDLDGWIAVSDLITLMAPLGVDQQSVRSAISRLKQREILVPGSRDGVAGYALSDWGQRLVAAGDRRILTRQPPARLSDGWLLVVFSVPESERNRRHQLRSQLAGLGFGTAAAGVWVAPSHLLDEATEVLRRHDLDQYVTFFRAEHLPGTNGTTAASWWDLDTLRRAYDEFVDTHAPIHRDWSARPAGDEAAFVDYVRTLTAWRRLPYLDPRLPVETLPPDWSGEAAADVFFGLRKLLAGPALRHVREVTAGPRTPGSR